ncbi:MAG: hypothetical protein AAGC46_16175 [Solirubrobacteraceae bacterium]|nr:hypothetical protein [Patulibacter sp.]
MTFDDDFIAFLEDGTPEQLASHLEQFSKAELGPPTMRIGVEPKPAPKV